MVSYRAKMMNIVAVWMILSSLGASMLLSPEPILTNNGESSGPLEAAKQASKQSVQYASDAARMTGEGIREKVAAGMHSTGELTNSAIHALKDTSHAGLKKIGLASPEKTTFEQWELGLRDAKSKVAAAAKWSHDDGARADENRKWELRRAREMYENLKKYGELEPPTATEILKDKAEGAFESAENAATAVKDTVVGAAEKMKEGAQYTYETAEEAAASAKRRVENAAGSVKEGSKDALRYGEEKSSRSAESVNDLASRIGQSVQENMNAAGSEVLDTADSAKDSTYETIGSAYEYAAGTLKSAAGKTSEFLRSGEESDASYRDRLRMATEQTSDTLKRRAKDAANFMPNVGQGLSPGNLEKTVEPAQDRAGDYQSVADTAGDYARSVKETISGSSENSRSNWREEFLNKIGIREEADLSKIDLTVGNVKGYWSGGGWFHKPGEALNDAAGESYEAGRIVQDKVSDSVHNVGDHLRHAKDNLVSKAKHMSGTAPEEFCESTEGAKRQARSGSGLNYSVEAEQADSKDGAEQKGPFSSLLWWIRSAALAWIISSINAVHLLSFSFTYGTSLWVTFVSGYVLSKCLSRQQFFSVQSKLFPTYLRVIGVGQAVCLVMYMMLHSWMSSSSGEKLQHFNLWTVLVSTLINIFCLEPRTTMTMFEKLKIEKEEGKRAEEAAAKRVSDLREATTSVDGVMKSQKTEMNQKFNVLHGWSSMFNLLGLLGETWHLWHLSRALAL